MKRQVAQLQCSVFDLGIEGHVAQVKALLLEFGDPDDEIGIHGSEAVKRHGNIRDDSSPLGARLGVSDLVTNEQWLHIQPVRMDLHAQDRCYAGSEADRAGQVAVAEPDIRVFDQELAAVTADHTVEPEGLVLEFPAGNRAQARETGHIHGEPELAHLQAVAAMERARGAETSVRQRYVDLFHQQRVAAPLQRQIEGERRFCGLEAGDSAQQAPNVLAPALQIDIQPVPFGR